MKPSRMVLNGVNFDLRKGEILGIAGLMGSGRTELVTTIFGEYGKITRGKITLEGQECTSTSAREAMHEGISLVPEDRKGQGLVLMQSIVKNISLANLDQFSAFFRIDGDAELAAATAAGQEPGDQGAQPEAGLSIRSRAATSRRSSSPNGCSPSPRS